MELFAPPGLAAPDLDRRFGGLARMYGTAGARRIRAAHMVVVGLGGVGSWAAEAAARSGVACLTLIDLDHIAESNINRQVHALDSTLGQAKVQAMRNRIADINPECRVNCIEEFVDAKNWPEILLHGTGGDHKHAAVIDACDQVKAKTSMAVWAKQNNAIFISVGAAGGKRFSHLVNVDDLAVVTHDPLLAQLRYRLRKEHGYSRVGKMNTTCVFSREAVRKSSVDIALTGSANDTGNGQTETATAITQTDGSLNCHGYGSVVSVTATFGMCALGWVLDKIAG